jgi:hypothetical protein
MGLGANNKRNSNPEPLFCAHIDSYFPGSEMANPLYLTSYHFTKFDTLTETFERDSTFSYNDEFVPDPSKIPLFFTFKDSTRLEREMATRNKKTVEVEVYKKRLSANFFIAPSTAYFVQPITVEKDFQKELAKKLDIDYDKTMITESKFLTGSSFKHNQHNKSIYKYFMRWYEYKNNKLIKFFMENDELMNLMCDIFYFCLEDNILSIKNIKINTLSISKNENKKRIIQNKKKKITNKKKIVNLKKV